VISLLSETTIQNLIQDYGLWIVFIVVMSESMGVPLPGETTLVAAGIYAGSTQGIDPYLLVAVAAAAAVVGDNIGYLIGRTVGLRLLLRYGRYASLTEARLKLGRYLFLRHGGKIVFFGRFVALLRTLTALLAGVDQMPWLRFLFFNACGGICWAAAFGFGAYLFGEKVRSISGPIAIAMVLIAATSILVGAIYLRRHEEELQRRAEQAFPGPLRPASPRTPGP
jgi:membrane protein DedA with SNARE-associated domain